MGSDSICTSFSPWCTFKSTMDCCITLANSHPLGGQFGPHNTLEKLQHCFHWPGMMVEVQRFCQWCSQRGPPPCVPAPLFPLLIIGVPFEGMDLVGPLLKSVRSHEYLLVLIDYGTHDPEAVPLWKVSSQNITKELVLVFSQVDILHYCAELFKDHRSYLGSCRTGCCTCSTSTC